MTRTVRVFVACVSVAAVVSTGALFALEPELRPGDASVVALLAALAVLAEILAFLLPRAARGSIAFIPYLAAVLVVPGWLTVLAATGVKALVEPFIVRSSIKALFNVAQTALSTVTAVVAYKLLGGSSLLDFRGESLLDITTATGVAAFAALVLSFVVNTLLVSAVVALSSRRRVLDVWKENTRGSIGIDLLATPVVFLFAWAYATWGPMVALAVWMPILGLRQLNKTNIELEQMNRELLQLMVKSIEARDPYTSGHSRRVEHFAILIARAFKLPERETRRVGQAALLHDVGKIHEKYAPILLKADRLTPSEWATIQQHPIDGAELVSTMTQLKDLVPAIRHHHERWDGAGYPDGLRGEAIPLPARIIALADTIDAMTSERPYRPALDPEAVRREVIRCRGTQFDPGIVDRLLSDAAWRTIFSPPRDRVTYGELQLVGNAHQG